MGSGQRQSRKNHRSSAMSILVCGDLDRAFSRAPEYWVVNGSIAAQNMILAAEDLGIGSVWLGMWPQEDKVTIQKEYFHLPDHIVPHSVIAFGYPDEVKDGEHPDYEEDRVHRNRW